MKNVVAATAFAVLVLLVCVLIASAFASDTPRERFASVNDRPVLENVDDIRNARITGNTAFRVGDELYIVKNLPEEYLKYSEWYCRVQ